MRHGRTVWNEKHICQGRSQNRLSKTGKLQTEEQAEKFKNVKIDLIFTSPLMRTMQTTNIINKFHNAKVIRDARIIEVDQGIFTGKSKDKLTDEEKFEINKSKENNKMETYEEIYNRTLDFLNDLRKNYKDKKILVVTHGMIASYIEKIGKRDGLNKNELKNYSNFLNAEIKKIII